MKTAILQFLAGIFFCLLILYFILLKVTDPAPSPSPTPTSQPSAIPSATPLPSAVPTPHPLIQLDSPQPEAQISSPLTITGKARGNWFFEATFPIVLTDSDGKIIAEGFATADGDWMTEEFVPFTATLSFAKQTTNDRGTLILKKANASGLPEHDQEKEVSVFFK